MIEILSETGSTNADIVTRLRVGEPVADDYWLVADRQTAGRGRQGREWFDGAGNFMGSTAVNLTPGDPPAPTLALVAGLALYETAKTICHPAEGLQLKWPNDLMLGTAKLAGVLLERERDAVVVGIGVNLVAAPQLPDRQTIALSDIGATVDRDAFAAELARIFAEELDRWRKSGIAQLLRRWALAAHPAGTPLSFHDAAGESVRGTFAGLANDGSLQLRLADGTTRTVSSGEVHFAAGH